MNSSFSFRKTRFLRPHPGDGFGNRKTTRKSIPAIWQRESIRGISSMDTDDRIPEGRKHTEHHKPTLRFRFLLCTVLPLGVSALLYPIAKFTSDGGETYKDSLVFAAAAYGVLSGFLLLLMVMTDVSLSSAGEKGVRLSERITSTLLVLFIDTLILFVFIWFIQH
jgi:hypothetical protein